MSNTPFRVIRTTGRRSKRPVMEDYMNAMEFFVSTHEEDLEALDLYQWHERNPESYSQFLFIGIRGVCLAGRTTRDEDLTPDDIVARKDMIVALTSMFSVLSPRELMQQYPVRKRYDGEKLQRKDYFYTMERISCLNIDRPIGSQVDTLDLLYDYMNRDIDMFVVEAIHTADLMSSKDGKPGIIREYLENHGTVSFIPHENEGVQNPAAERSYPGKKSRPKVPKWTEILSGKSAGNNYEGH